VQLKIRVPLTTVAVVTTQRAPMQILARHASAIQVSPVTDTPAQVRVISSYTDVVEIWLIDTMKRVFSYFYFAKLSTHDKTLYICQRQKYFN